MYRLNRTKQSSYVHRRITFLNLNSLNQCHQYLIKCKNNKFLLKLFLHTKHCSVINTDKLIKLNIFEWKDHNIVGILERFPQNFQLLFYWTDWRIYHFFEFIRSAFPEVSILLKIRTLSLGSCLSCLSLNHHVHFSVNIIRYIRRPLFYDCIKNHWLIW